LHSLGTARRSGKELVSFPLEVPCRPHLQPRNLPNGRTIRIRGFLIEDEEDARAWERCEFGDRCGDISFAGFDLDDDCLSIACPVQVHGLPTTDGVLFRSSVLVAREPSAALFAPVFVRCPPTPSCTGDTEPLVARRGEREDLDAPRQCGHVLK